MTNGKKYKIGLGSSAAIAVGVVASIFHLHQQDIDCPQIKKIMFNIACIAHYLVQEKLGSGFDIAASVWGGVNYYKRFDAEWLTNEIQNSGIINILDKEWPGLDCEQLTFPSQLSLLVGFVGYSANTKKLIRSVYDFRSKSPQKYMEKMQEIAEVVDKLKHSIHHAQNSEILALLTKNRYLLQEMSLFSYRKLETKELALLADIAESHNAAGKFSGAGGGDCGIAIVPDNQNHGLILDDWKNNNIIPIPLKLTNKGVHVVM